MTVPEVLFVCVHNAGRSQMAAGLLDHHANGRVHARSAGSAPADEINPAAVQAMAEVGIDLSHEYPKPLTDEVVRAADVVITMGCGDACPIYPGKRYEDWEIDDPAGKSLAEVRQIRDHLDARVRRLVAELLQVDTSDLLSVTEELLQESSPDERAGLALPLVAVVAPELDVDLVQAGDDAAAYLESFPVPGRAVVDLADQAARWLALRLATDERRLRLREALEALATEHAAEYPLTAAALRELLSEPPASDPRQDELWVGLTRAVVDEQVSRLSW